MPAVGLGLARTPACDRQLFAEQSSDSARPDNIWLRDLCLRFPSWPMASVSLNRLLHRICLQRERGPPRRTATVSVGLWLLRWLTDHADNCSLQCVTVSGCDGRHCGRGRRQGLALASGVAQRPWMCVAQPCGSSGPFTSRRLPGVQQSNKARREVTDPTSADRLRCAGDLQQ